MVEWTHQDLRIQCASPESFETIRDLLYEAALWIKGKGLLQWNDVPTGARDSKIRAMLESGETFLAYKNGQVVGTFTLQNAPGNWDQELWNTHAIDFSDTIFVHRFATSRAFSGQSIGKTMLDWAHDYAQEKGRHFLRLDCVGYNQPLNAFYQSCGFTFLGQADNGFSLYEKEVFK